MKVAVFDMDNTILRTSFIDNAARVFGFKEELSVLKNEKDPVSRTKLIAKLLTGQPLVSLLEITDRIQITSGLGDLTGELKRRGYLTGIISDSYDCISGHLMRTYGLDFSYSNTLKFAGGLATGKVEILSSFAHRQNSLCNHKYCKLNVLISVCQLHKISLKNTMMIGDGENDICSIRQAGIGISFCSTSSNVDSAADHIIKEPDFNLLRKILN